jgi:hypothetical protein
MADRDESARPVPSRGASSEAPGRPTPSDSPYSWQRGDSGPSVREGGAEDLSGDPIDRLWAAIDRLADAIDGLCRSAPSASPSVLRALEDVRDLLRDDSRGARAAASSEGTAPGSASPEPESIRPYRGERGGQSHV